MWSSQGGVSCNRLLVFTQEAGCLPCDGDLGPSLRKHVSAPPAELVCVL